MNFDSKDFGKRIRKLRQCVGLSREKLAAKVGYSDSTIESWEKGKRVPRLGDVLSLAKALSSSVSELIGESKNTVKLAEKEEMILKGLDVVDSSASRPILYSGIDEVISVC